ncbi:hypothetical protein BJX63DRAFT_345435 [Aspergillus granulosus]|uniref:Uncharacterized protein n=1 Tax=Aspergillus granulosus TaxID=176169 RepID=A0ABR4H2S5_9EURO
MLSEDSSAHGCSAAQRNANSCMQNASLAIYLLSRVRVQSSPVWCIVFMTAVVHAWYTYEVECMYVCMCDSEVVESEGVADDDRKGWEGKGRGREEGNISHQIKPRGYLSVYRMNI